MAGLPALIDRVTSGIDAGRRRAPRLDRVIRTQEHYSKMQGSNNAGGISYYGFLSFFPLVLAAEHTKHLALGTAVAIEELAAGRAPR